MENQTPLTSSTVQAEVSRFMSRVYGWMTFGIALTGMISFYIQTQPDLMTSLVKTPGVFLGLIIAELAVVLSLSFLIQKMSPLVASLLYVFYSALNGVTLSVVFYAYTMESVAQVFAITAVGFAGLSVFGLVTKRDLGPIGSFCTMGLFGLLGWGLLSLIFPGMMSGSLSPTYSVLGLLVFSGLTAYDTQKIKGFYAPENEGTAVEGRGAIFGALILYLDFINLFLNLLRLMGRRR